MDCPDCASDRTGVIDTATSDGGAAVRRRRECQRCGFRFTTYERAEWDTLQVKKRDGSIEPFETAKLRAGIERAVEKRPVAADDVDRIVDAVEAALAEREERIVASTLIGDLVADRLREIDSVAYIRFVSVYRAFSEPEEFLRELDAVLDERPTADPADSRLADFEPNDDATSDSPDDDIPSDFPDDDTPSDSRIDDSSTGDPPDDPPD